MAAFGSKASVYDDLMRFKPIELSPNGWAIQAGVSRTVWADMKRHNNPSRRILEKLLLAAGSSLAEFEALRVGPVPDALNQPDGTGVVGDHRGSSWRGAPLPPIPVYSCKLAQFLGTGGPIDCLSLDRSRTLASQPRPASLATDRNAFALTMLDDSMWPRFRLGRRIIVSPLEPVEHGDDALVAIGRDASGHELVIVRALIRRTGPRLELRQHNPARSISVELATSSAIAKIIGEAY